jgi:hypothetical protein
MVFSAEGDNVESTKAAINGSNEGQLPRLILMGQAKLFGRFIHRGRWDCGPRFLAYRKDLLN